MSKARNVLGVITGVILILSSGAHSLLGWKSMREQLVGAGASPDLVTGLAIGWNFAGFAIFVFGVLVLLTFIPRLRGLYRDLTTARVIGWSYLLAGGAAYSVSKSIFFINIFLVPAILILIASSERDEE
jgi:hypothetical protein